MTTKLVFLVIFIFAAFCTDENNEETAQESNENLQNQFNLPNDSSVQIFRDKHTNEMFWKDPKNYIPNEKKKEIAFALQQKGEKKSNCIFDCFTFWLWNVPIEAHPFVKELMSVMSENIDVRRRTKFNRSALMFAAYFSAEKAVLRLIERGAELEDVDGYGWNALHYSSWRGNESLCKILSEKGKNVNDQNNDGETPLMLAGGNECVEAVKTLLQSGASTKITDKFGKTALENARLKCAEIIEAYESKTFKKESKCVNV